MWAPYGHQRISKKDVFNGVSENFLTATYGVNCPIRTFSGPHTPIIGWPDSYCPIPNDAHPRAIFGHIDVPARHHPPPPASAARYRVDTYKFLAGGSGSIPGWFGQLSAPKQTAINTRRNFLVPEGFSYFVTSMTAPVASGWSVRRVDLAPTAPPYHGAHLKRTFVNRSTLTSAAILAGL